MSLCWLAFLFIPPHIHTHVEERSTACMTSNDEKKKKAKKNVNIIPPTDRKKTEITFL